MLSVESQSDDVLGTKEIPPPEEVAAILPEVVQSGGWEKCWVEGVTPWDLGRPTPIVLHLLQTGNLPKGRVLIPGCGSGYDVVAIACSERYVIGLDISDTLVKKVTERTSSLPNANHFTFIKEDFFTWRPDELFDMIFEYVFFCAIEPNMRETWAKSVDELLKPDGELITLMYPMGDDYEGGPPYKISVAEYEEVLVPLGFKIVSVEDNALALGPRKGREKLARWKKVEKKSSEATT